MNCHALCFLGQDVRSSSYSCGDKKTCLLSVCARLDPHLVQQWFSGVSGRNLKDHMKENIRAAFINNTAPVFREPLRGG